jgi:hypothetical protein
MKMSNKEATAEELVFHREYTLDDYAEARQHALYLPDSESMLLLLFIIGQFMFSGAVAARPPFLALQFWQSVQVRYKERR